MWREKILSWNSIASGLFIIRLDIKSMIKKIKLKKETLREKRLLKTMSPKLITL